VHLYDYLCGRRMIMLPPSIHPQTGQPYRANCDLLDVLDDLPSLPEDFAKAVWAALRSKGCVVRTIPPPRD
jgi:putative DNA primase/helicase